MVRLSLTAIGRGRVLPFFFFSDLKNKVTAATDPSRLAMGQTVNSPVSGAERLTAESTLRRKIKMRGLAFVSTLTKENS